MSNLLSQAFGIQLRRERFSDIIQQLSRLAGLVLALEQQLPLIFELFPCGFSLYFLGYISHNAHQPHRLSVGVKIGAADGLEPAHCAIGPDDAKARIHVANSQRLARLAVDPLAIFRVDVGQPVFIRFWVLLRLLAKQCAMARAAHDEAGTDIPVPQTELGRLFSQKETL